MLFQEIVKGHCHRRSFRIGSINVKPQSLMFDGSCSCWSESCDFYFPLNKIGEIFFQRFDPRWTVEDQDVIIKIVEVGKMAAYSFVEDADSVFYTVLAEKIGDFSVMGFRQRYKEIIILVLDDQVDNILKLRFPMEYFTLTINNIFLQVKCHILGYAEILHVVGDHNPQFIADPEEMVDTCFACKNHCCKVEDINFLLTKILGGYTLNLNKRFEINLQIIFFSQLEIWGFRIVRFWLRY